MARPPFIRLTYLGQPLKRGKLLLLPASSADKGDQDPAGGGSADGGGAVPGGEASALSGAQLLARLGQEGCYDLRRFRPFWYCHTRGGWARLNPDSTVPTAVEGLAHPERIDVMLEDSFLWPNDAAAGYPSTNSEDLVSTFRDRNGPTVAPLSRSEEMDAGGEYFGIGIVHGKREVNQGTLWRSAYQLGASFLFSIGARFKARDNSEDTMETWQRLPVFSWADFEAFASSAPYAAQWVSIEMGGTPLETFVHPQRAVYLLGSEDNGLPPSVVAACRHHVSLPVAPGRSASFNVAAAGTMVLYDRLLKQRHGRTSPVEPDSLGEEFTGCMP